MAAGGGLGTCRGETVLSLNVERVRVAASVLVSSTVDEAIDVALFELTTLFIRLSSAIVVPSAGASPEGLLVTRRTGTPVDEEQPGLDPELPRREDLPPEDLWTERRGESLAGMTGPSGADAVACGR